MKKIKGECDPDEVVCDELGDFTLEFLDVDQFFSRLCHLLF